MRQGRRGEGRHAGGEAEWGTRRSGGRGDRLDGAHLSELGCLEGRGGLRLGGGSLGALESEVLALGVGGGALVDDECLDDE